jgi:hypothetical protein
MPDGSSRRQRLPDRRLSELGTSLEHGTIVDADAQPVVGAGVEIDRTVGARVPVTLPAHREESTWQRRVVVEDREVDAGCDGLGTRLALQIGGRVEAARESGRRRDAALHAPRRDRERRGHTQQETGDETPRHDSEDQGAGHPAGRMLMIAIIALER